MRADVPPEYNRRVPVSQITVRLRLSAQFIKRTITLNVYGQRRISPAVVRCRQLYDLPFVLLGTPGVRLTKWNFKVARVRAAEEEEPRIENGPRYGAENEYR